MNLQTLTNLAANFAQDPQQSRYAGLYTSTLNLAQQQFALDSKCSFKDAPASTIVSGTAAYDLPTDFMWEKKVTFNGTPLSPISRMELDRLNPGSRWDTVTGTPRNYVIDPDEARKKILVYPIPADGDAGKSLILTYFALPADMVASGDVPLNSSALMAQFHIGLAAWCAWALLQNEQVTDAIRKKKEDLLSIYNDAVSQAVNTFGNTVSAPMRMRGVRSY